MSPEGRIVFGFHPVREALRAHPHRVETVFVRRGRAGRGGRLLELCRRHGVPVEEVPAGRLAELAAGGVHNGFVARLAADSEAEAAAAPAAGDPDLVVLLEDVQDPRNLGALLRVFEGAGVGRVYLRDRGTAPVTPTVVKASAGAAEWLDVQRVPNSAQLLERLKKEGYWVYGAAAEGEPAWEIDLTGKVVLCFGGEARGLRRRTRELCDKLASLPMRGRVGSLNVATAAAALAYEALRQRAAGGG